MGVSPQHLFLMGRPQGVRARFWKSPPAGITDPSYSLSSPSITFCIPLTTSAKRS
jgi:hypothetical protein